MLFDLYIRLETHSGSRIDFIQTDWLTELNRVETLVAEFASFLSLYLYYIFIFSYLAVLDLFDHVSPLLLSLYHPSAIN